MPDLEPLDFLEAIGYSVEAICIINARNLCGMSNTSSLLGCLKSIGWSELAGR